MAESRSKSRKPSDASSSQAEQPDLPPLFLDRSLGRGIVANALRNAGGEVHIHDDYFSPDEQDSVWIADVGKRGWAVLTKDRKIRYRETERMAIRSAGTALFVLISGDLQGKEMAAVFVRALPGIKRFLAAHQPPFIAKVYRDGRTVMSADLA